MRWPHRNATLEVVDDNWASDPPGQRRSELQAVETGAALLSGVLAFLLVEVVVWLVKALLDVTDPAWSGTTGYGFLLAAAAGVLTVLLRIVRTRKRGL